MNAATTDTVGQPQRAFTQKEIVAIIGGLMVGMFLAALEQTIVATALPRMAAALSGSVPVSWVIASYLVTATAATPIYGKLSDLYGRRPLLQAGIVIFLIGSLLCGFAHSMMALVLFRALQGIGGGGIFSTSHACIADIVSPRERGRYHAYFSAVYAAASVAGPVLGGVFADHLGWQWVFWINVPIGIVALWILQNQLRRLAAKRIRHRIDFEGAFLMISAICVVLLLTTVLGEGVGWDTPWVLSLAALSVILIVAMVFQERRAAEPILPPALFANPVYRVSIVSGLLTSVLMIGAVVFMPLFMQIVQGMSAENSGLMLIPLSGAIVIGSTTAGRLISRTGRYKILPLIGTALNALGFLLISFAGIGTSLAVVGIELMILSAGTGLCLPVQLVAVQNAVDPRDLGAVTASVNLFRSMGGSFGVTLFGALLAATLNATLRHLPAAMALGPNPASVLLHGGHRALAALPVGDRAAILGLAQDSFDLIFRVGAAVAAVNFVTQLFLPELPLRTTSGIEARLAASSAE